MLKKRLTNIALRSAAAVLLLAGMTACFTSVSDADGELEKAPKTQTVELDDYVPDGVSVTKIESANTAIADIANADSRAATAADGGSITSVIVTAKKAGKTHFIITTKDDGTWYLPFEVTADLDVKINKDDLTDKEPEGGSDDVVVNAAWDFDKGENASTNATILKFGGTNTALSADEIIEPDSGSGATLTILSNSNNKIKYGANKSGATEIASGGGIQQNAGGQERDFAELKVDGACTVTIVAAGATGSISSGSSNINSFSINEDNQFKVEVATKVDANKHEYTYTAAGAETIKITATGMKFMSIICSQ